MAARPEATGPARVLTVTDADPTVLQTGPETFEVWAEGTRVSATLAHHTRRALAPPGVPPLEVVTELVRFLAERQAWPPTGVCGEVALGPAAGRYPEFAEELRARLG